MTEVVSIAAGREHRARAALEHALADHTP